MPFSSRLKFWEKSLWGPGVAGAPVWCALEGKGVEMFPTGKSRYSHHSQGQEVMYHAHINSNFFSQQIRSSGFYTKFQPWQWAYEISPKSRVGQNWTSAIFKRTGFLGLTSIFVATLKAKVTICKKGKKRKDKIWILTFNQDCISQGSGCENSTKILFEALFTHPVEGSVI